MHRQTDRQTHKQYENNTCLLRHSWRADENRKENLLCSFQYLYIYVVVFIARRVACERRL